MISLGLAFLISNIDIRPRPPADAEKAIEEPASGAAVGAKEAVAPESA